MQLLEIKTIRIYPFLIPLQTGQVCPQIMLDYGLQISDPS